MLVQIQNVTKRFLDDIVLRGVSLDIGDNARLGLLGVNGAGKTTLLNLIEGSLTADEGSIIRARGLSTGYLRQNDALHSERTLDEEIRDAFAPLYALQAEMETLAAQLAQKPGDTALLLRYDAAQAKFEARDGYHIEDKIARVLNGLGFGGFNRATLVGTLSGGEKMRFGFAKLLLRQPDLLMLDEPTNHLDFGMLAWLEDYLATYKGAVLVVSHDRYFLDAVAQDVAELARGGLTLYHGGYTSFVAQKAQRLLEARRAYDKQQEEIAKMEDYVRRNLVRASTTGMAQSRRKALEKMERLERPPEDEKSIALKFDYDIEPYECVLACKGLGVSVGEGEAARQLYTGIDLEVLRGEKIALVGENGVGKSTFLKALQGLAPHGGSARWGGNVRLGYFDQELAGLPLDETVLEAVHSRYPAKTEFEIRSALGRLLLGGETVFKRVRELSGAMRAKVAFAILQMRRANVLLLDEPTNHLDYRAKEVLETALRNFSGTLIVVSHDRYFLRQVPSAILEMTPNGFLRTDGNFDDFLKKDKGTIFSPPILEESRGDEHEKIAPLSFKGGKRTKEQRAQDAQRRTGIATLEKEIEALETRILVNTDALQDPQNASDYELLADLAEQLKADNTALDAAMEDWLELTGGED